MAKYKSLQKYGEITVGMELYQKTPIGPMDGPYKILSIYIREGSGVKSVKSSPLDARITNGSRMAKQEENGMKVLNLTDLKLADWYVLVEPDADA